MTVKISVIVPIYGIERYIKRCAESLFQQSYTDFEIIFVNDCTKDHSIEILKNTISRFSNTSIKYQIVNHERNRGLAAARNTGVELSRGEYLMHLDGDDYLENNAIQTLVEAISDSSPDIVFYGHYILNKDGRSEIHPLFVESQKTAYLKSILLLEKPASIWNKLYKTDFYKNSGIHSIEGLNYGEDYVVVPRLIHLSQTNACVNKLLYNYDQSNINSYTSNVTEKSILNIKQATDVLVDFFSNVQDRNEYKEIVPLIKLRGMLSLVKMANKDCYNFIYNNFYPITIPNTGLSKSDKIILTLFKNRAFNTIAFLTKLFRKFKK